MAIKKYNIEDNSIDCSCLFKKIFLSRFLTTDNCNISVQISVKLMFTKKKVSFKN